MEDKSNQLVEHLFRTEYGKLLSSLTRFFGPSYLQLAEDVVQETLITALGTWSRDGIPDNPTGWLVQVAKRKALNELKRNKLLLKYTDNEVASREAHTELNAVFLDNEIEDNQLRMIFTCCNPSLSLESQIALTLKTLCGFGIKEVAKALLTNESTINKRLYRAKEKIRLSNDEFIIPQGVELEKRLEAVELTLYLLFNEGYNSSSGDKLIQKELCLEAIRLVQMLVGHFNNHYNLSALLALMCFHTARFEARLDDHGALVLFEDQDRSKWNAQLIQIGMKHFQDSIKGNTISAYHIEARIAAEHCLATSFEKTNWTVIYDQYQLLQKIKPNPIIDLNLAIIQSKIGGVEASLKMLDELASDKQLKNYHLLPATQGVFQMQIGNYGTAESLLIRALALKPSGAERVLIENKLDECKKQLP